MICLHVPFMQSVGQRVGRVQVGVGTWVVVGGCTDVVSSYDMVAVPSSVMVCVSVKEFIAVGEALSVNEGV